MAETYNRYAIYVAPRTDSPLGRFGNAWLGRDPETRERLPRPIVTGYSEDDIAEITSAPSRYGFHGTMVAPFHLGKGMSEDVLLTAVARVAEDVMPVTVPAFDIKALGSFLAIVPDIPSDDLHALAAHCVERMDPYRKELSDEDLERRRAGGLTPNQDRLLGRWGYPYVMEEFRFHMTLTDKLKEPKRSQLRADLFDYASTVLGPYTFDELCVFAEPSPGAAFELIERFEVGQRHVVAQSA